MYPNFKTQFIALSLFLVSCSGGGGDGRSDGSSGADFGCDGNCANQSLSAADVKVVLEQAIGAADSLGVKGTFAVLDRVGNVLAVYQMSGALKNSTVRGGIGAVGGLENVTVPSSLAAISKAGTGAYLSSQGNAFSTRTASQIIQEHFYPTENHQPSGPLFGVQFSQLACSDVTVRNSDVAARIPSGSNKYQAGGSIGPRALPLGLSADSGGLPLYKSGDLVGGVGVELDGVYSFDRDLTDYDDDPEERIAMLASIGYEAPSERTASNIIVGGKSLRFSDISYDELTTTNSGTYDESKLLSIPEYTNGSIKAGVAFGTRASGYARTSRAGRSAVVLVNASGGNRFPTRAGSSLPGGAELKVSEVNSILDSAILTAYRSRAAIRRPLDSSVQVSIWVIDTQGIPLGFTRTNDAPIFGTDVALQKARTATFFSSLDAARKLTLARSRNSVGTFADYSGAARNYLGTTALSNGIAFSNRAVGNFARPYFPDGIEGTPNGPFSLPFPGTSAGRTWSPFNDGLQLDLNFQRFVRTLGVPAAPASVPGACTDEGTFGRRIANGIQIFAGAVPLYRGRTLVGGIGISGDGIDQDDMVAFYGASRQGLDYAGHSSVGDALYGFNAPPDMRSDQASILINSEVRLRYVNCPEAPFVGDDSQNVCD